MRHFQDNFIAFNLSTEYEHFFVDSKLMDDIREAVLLCLEDAKKVEFEFRYNSILRY
jgi:hypothetical protein